MDTEDLPTDKLENLLRRADADRDGMLDYEEFVQLVSIMLFVFIGVNFNFLSI